MGGRRLSTIADEELFEVFARHKSADPLHHIGYVSAPGPDLAAMYARAIYDEFMWVEMIIVPRQAITTVIEA